MAINGEHGKILKEIHGLSLQMAVMKERQDLNHQENKTDIGVLFDKIDVVEKRVNLLPCSAHIEKFNQYDNTRKVLIGSIISIVILAFGFASMWGMTKQQVKENKYDIRKCCK